MPKIKYTEETKLRLVKYILEGNIMNEAAKKFGTGKQNIQKWRAAYKEHRKKGLKVRQNNRSKYTSEFKVYMIKYKKNQQLSIRNTATYFNITT